MSKKRLTKNEVIRFLRVPRDELPSDSTVISMHEIAEVVWPIDASKFADNSDAGEGGDNPSLQFTGDVEALFPVFKLALWAAERGFKRGDKEALFYALFASALQGIPLPPWAADAVINAYYGAKLGHKYASWDEVFGPPHKKNEKRSAKRQMRKLRAPVWRTVYELRKERPGRDVFPDVAAKFGIGVDLARRYFYELDRIVELEKELGAEIEKEERLIEAERQASKNFPK